MNRRIPALIRRPGARESVGGGAPALIAMPTSDLLTAVDPRYGATLDGSDRVLAMADPSGNTTGVAQATAGKRPLYGATSGANGLPGLTMTIARNDGLSWLSTIRAGTGPITVYAIVKINDPAAANQAVFDVATGRLTMYVNGATRMIVSGSTNLNSAAVGTTHLLMVYRSGSGTATLSVTGIADVSAASANVALSGATAVGSGSTIDRPCEGVYSMVYVYGVKHDSTQKAAHVAIVNSIWGVTA